MLVSLLTMVTNVFAQSEIGINNWNTVWAEWNPSTFSVDQKDADNQSFTGLSLGYSHAFSLSLTTPLFVEVGLGGQYSHYENEWYEEEILDWGDGPFSHMSRRDNILDMWSLKAPINFLYRFDIPNSPVSLLPFVGVNLRYNISGEMEDYNGYSSQERDVFDSEEMGGSNNTYNRFQLGWHIGMKANFLKHIMVGLSYGTDFTEIAKKTKINTLTITAGYTF